MNHVTQLQEYIVPDIAGPQFTWVNLAAKQWILDKSEESLNELRKCLDNYSPSKSLLRYRISNEVVSNRIQIASRLFDLKFPLHREEIIYHAENSAGRPLYPNWKRVCCLELPAGLSRKLKIFEVQVGIIVLSMAFISERLWSLRKWTDGLVNLHVISKIQNPNILSLIKISGVLTQCFVLFNAIRGWLILYQLRAELFDVWKGTPGWQERLDNKIEALPRQTLFGLSDQVIVQMQINAIASMFNCIQWVRSCLLEMSERARNERQEIAQQEACKIWLRSLGLEAPV